PEKIDVSMHRSSLTDALFRPLSVDWSPYLASLDLRRTVTDEIVKRIDATPLQKNPIVVVRGESAVGKTTVAKRVAVDLSPQGYVVLWCRRAPTEMWHNAYRKLVAELKDWLSQQTPKAPRVAIICDDPWLVGISPRELLTICETVHLDAVLVFSFRN